MPDGALTPTVPRFHAAITVRRGSATPTPRSAGLTFTPNWAGIAVARSPARSASFQSRTVYVAVLTPPDDAVLAPAGNLWVELVHRTGRVDVPVTRTLECAPAPSNLFASVARPPAVVATLTSLPGVATLAIRPGLVSRTRGDSSLVLLRKVTRCSILLPTVATSAPLHLGYVEYWGVMLDFLFDETGVPFSDGAGGKFEHYF